MTDTATPGALDLAARVRKALSRETHDLWRMDVFSDPECLCGRFRTKAIGPDSADSWRQHLIDSAVAALATPTAEPAVPVETEARGE